MDRVHAAVEAGRCVVAVGAHLLRDAKVLLALKDRAQGMPSVALSGPAVPPTKVPNVDAISRAIGQPDGVIVFIEPEDKDRPGMQKIAEFLQKAPHKPTVVVVSRSANPLLYNMLFRGLPLQIEKGRGPAFLRKLPRPVASEIEAAPVEVAKAAVKGTGSQGASGVRRIFVGRDDEVAGLTELLGQGGPIVVHGAEGSGRNVLLDEVLGGSELTRHLDVMLGRGAGFDTLIARLAEITSQAGATQLAEALSDGKATPIAVVDAAIQALQAAESAADQVLVVQPLESAIGRQLDFFRKDRLATLVQALLGNRYPLRLIFVAEGKPQAFDHEENQAARLFHVPGLKGRFFHEIFEAYHAPEFEREKFGPLSEKIYGHAMAARQYAIETRERDKGVDLVDDPKFMKMADPGDTGALRRVLRKRVDGLNKKDRLALARIAHLRLPVDGRTLAELGIPRKLRLSFLADGLMEYGGTEDKRIYRVHPLVKSCFRMREISDFDTLAELARMHAYFGKSAEGPDRIAHVQEANRCLVAARRGRDTIDLRYPDYDPECEAVIGMMRSKRPHFDLAQQRLNWLLKQVPGNADVHLLQLELLRRLDAKREAIEEAYETAMTQAPVAEVFQDACTWYLSRRARGKAITVLEKAVEVLPNETRLKTRLASLLLRQGRRNEALDLLKAAMEQSPMLPDAYGLLGMARFDEGIEALPRAEELLREAVRLAPNDRVQIPRLCTLLLAKAKVSEGLERDAILEEIRELLARITRDKVKHADGFLLLAKVERVAGNLDRADWLLKQARKHADKRNRIGNRLRFEWARLATERGDLDKAEKDIRDLIERDQGNPELFMALAQVLKRREQLIPAHAELMRASERVPPNSLRGQEVAARLTELQQAIEAQAAAVAAGTAPTPTEQVQVGTKSKDAFGAPPDKVDHVRTVRRRPGQASAEQGKSAAESAEASARPAADTAADVATSVATSVVEKAAQAVDAVQGKSDPQAEHKAAEEAGEAIGKTAHSVAESAAHAVGDVVDGLAHAAEEVAKAVSTGAGQVAKDAQGAAEVAHSAERPATDADASPDDGADEAPTVIDEGQAADADDAPTVVDDGGEAEADSKNA